MARTALIGWKKGELVDATGFEKLSAWYTWWALSTYISDHNLSVSMEEIGRQLARAHANAVALDEISIFHLLSPRQVADYHHEIFNKHGIPSYLFGGTLAVPSVHFPVPGGWSQALFDANVYSSLWCEGCDTSP